MAWGQVRAFTADLHAEGIPGVVFGASIAAPQEDLVEDKLGSCILLQYENQKSSKVDRIWKFYSRCLIAERNIFCYDLERLR